MGINYEVTDIRTGKTSLFVPGRSSRGGSIERILRGCEFDGTVIGCLDKLYKGLPFLPTILANSFINPKPCVFRSGAEAGTTGEYARIENGELIVHFKRIFPGPVGWDLRLIDNKYPLRDKVIEETGELYSVKEYRDDVAVMRHAYGKDYVIVASPQHIVPSSQIDYKSVLELAIVACDREFKDPAVQYVTFGQNNAGLPKFMEIPPSVMVDFMAQFMSVPKKIRRELSESKSKFGIYVSEGHKCGNSQDHPHFRVDSWPDFPPRTKDIMNIADKIMTSIQSYALDPSHLENHLGYLVIHSTENFIIYADRAPPYSGSLVVEARHAQNLLDLKEMEMVQEAAEALQTAQMLIDAVYNSPPCNLHTIQVPPHCRTDFSNVRLMFYLLPRINVHAFYENTTGIAAVTEIPENVAYDMREKVLPRIIKAPQAGNLVLA